MKRTNRLLKRDANNLRKTKNEVHALMYKLLLECWNAETPHFGGAGPHRYDGAEKKCAYCNRPIDWEPKHASYFASELAAEDDGDV